MKGAGKSVIVLLLLLLFCSFPFSCYAAEGYSYLDSDSYYSGTDLEDKRLIFFPLLPEDRVSDKYIIFYYPTDGQYYLFFNSADDFFYYRNAGWFVNLATNYFYRYNHQISNKWEFAFSCSGMATNYSFRGLKLIDSNAFVDNHAFNDGNYDTYSAKTGYKVYWQLSYIELSVLHWLDYFADYVLSHEWLRYSFLIFFVGEVFIFVFLVIRRIGELRNETS